MSADPAPPAGTDSAAGERTELSWARAGLSLVVTATLLIKHTVVVGGWLGMAVGVLVLTLGGLAASLPLRRYLTTGADATASRAPAVRTAAATCTGVGLLSLVVLLVPEQR